MASYRCESCGKNFDPEKSEICPKCGAAMPPSLMTRIERKQTAARMRAEGKMNYDDHCHEDDSWRGSHGAQTHRAAVREHEAELRSNYAAHKPVDHPTRVSNANPARNPAPSQRKKPKSFQQKIEEKPALLLLIFLLPLAFFILSMVLSSLIAWINGFAGNFSFQFP